MKIKIIPQTAVIKLLAAIKETPVKEVKELKKDIKDAQKGKI